MVSVYSACCPAIRGYCAGIPEPAGPWQPAHAGTDFSGMPARQIRWPSSSVSLFRAKAGFAAWSEKLAATYESFTTSIVSYKPELSLLPEKPRPGEGNTFVIYDIWSIIPGREQEFEALAKEIAALAKAKGTVDAWACLAGELGCEQPVYFYCAVDKGPAEFWTHNAEMWAAMGSDADIIMDKSTKLLRKRRMQTAWYRAELSYTPKK